MLQFGHDLSVVETLKFFKAPLRSACFNSATTFQSWKHVLCNFLGRRPGRRFNSATTFQSWKLNMMATIYITARALQFGHDLSVVETRRLGNGDPADTTASIRPRPFSRGNKCSMEILGAGGGLQFGHDLSVVETRMKWQ